MMYTGTNTDQDNRFSDKEKKLLKQMKFHPCLSQQVDMTKVQLDVIKPWISDKLTEMLKMDDDVVVNFVYNQLEVKFPDPKKMQINLTGFLQSKNSMEFMTELWQLLISAQENPKGIPFSFINLKREELAIKKELNQTQNSADTIDLAMSGIPNSTFKVNTAHSSGFIEQPEPLRKNVEIDKFDNEEIPQLIKKLDDIVKNTVVDKPLDLFGKYVASELRQLPKRAAILLQQDIQNCITRAKLDILDDASVKQSPQSMASAAGSSKRRRSDD